MKLYVASVGWHGELRDWDWSRAFVTEAEAKAVAEAVARDNHARALAEEERRNFVTSEPFPDTLAWHESSSGWQEADYSCYMVARVVTYDTDAPDVAVEHSSVSVSIA